MIAKVRDRPHRSAMAIAKILALFAAAVSAQASAAERSGPAHLGVTATVVRPVEVVSVSPGGDGAVAVVRNSRSVQVLAEPGTIVQIEDTVIVSSDASDLLFITIVF